MFQARRRFPWLTVAWEETGGGVEVMRKEVIEGRQGTLSTALLSLTETNTSL